MRKYQYQAIMNDGLEIQSPRDTRAEALQDIREAAIADCNDNYDGDRERYNEAVERGFVEYFIEKVAYGDGYCCNMGMDECTPQIGPRGGVRFV